FGNQSSVRSILRDAAHPQMMNGRLLYIDEPYKRQTGRWHCNASSLVESRQRRETALGGLVKRCMG
ncbi:MAG TPA: hypothetical protein VJR47_13200, partial [Stellaceae bacterium]|nr:hypothetical protein [Stellaceae bacterium]